MLKDIVCKICDTPIKVASAGLSGGRLHSTVWNHYEESKDLEHKAVLNKSKVGK